MSGFPCLNKQITVERGRQPTDLGNIYEVPEGESFSLTYTCIIYFLPPHPEAPLFPWQRRSQQEVRSPLLCPLHVKRDNDNFMSRYSSHDQQTITTRFLSSCPWKHIKHPLFAPGAWGRWTPYQRLVVNLLSDELVLTEGVACLSCDGVNGAFLHLLLDGTEEGEERFPCTLLQRGLEREEQCKSLARGGKLWSSLSAQFNNVWQKKTKTKMLLLFVMFSRLPCFQSCWARLINITPQTQLHL